MKRKNNRTPIRHALALFIAGLIVLAPVASAHGNMEHVTGTVVKVNNDVVSVKTAKATVDVHLDAQTEFVRGNQQVQKSELKAGDRVVIHAAKKNGVLVAHEVKLGTAGQTASTKSKRTTK